MPEAEKLISRQNPYIEAVMEEEEDPDEEFGYCSATNRIVIVSPMPRRIHLLVRELTAACYDVLMFHHADPPLLARLQPDLLIADLSHPEDWPQGIEWLEGPELAHVPILRLVPPEAAEMEGNLGWPAPMPEALSFIRSQATAAFLRKAVGAPKKLEPVLLPQAEASGADNPYSLRLHDLTLDLKRHSVSRGNARLDLTKTEFDLLRTLLEAEGSVLSRQELMDRVWGDDYFGGSNTVDVHVKTLRQKLGDDPRNPRYIVTVRGIGYRSAEG